MCEGASTSSSSSSSSGSNNSRENDGGVMVQMVSKSKSERLLEKYFDAFEFDFDYEESGIWSPPVRRTAYLGSPGRVFTEEELVDKLRSVLEKSNSVCDGSRRAGKACFHAWGCVSSLFSAFQKRVKRRKRLTYDV